MTRRTSPFLMNESSVQMVDDAIIALARLFARQAAQETADGVMANREEKTQNAAKTPSQSE